MLISRRVDRLGTCLKMILNSYHFDPWVGLFKPITKSFFLSCWLPDKQSLIQRNIFLWSGDSPYGHWYLATSAWCFSFVEGHLWQQKRNTVDTSEKRGKKNKHTPHKLWGDFLEPSFGYLIKSLGTEICPSDTQLISTFCPMPCSVQRPPGTSFGNYSWQHPKIEIWIYQHSPRIFVEPKGGAEWHPLPSIWHPLKGPGMNMLLHITLF